MRIINAVRSGIILAWRHKIAAAGIALMISVICVVLVVALADVITQTSVIIGAKKLRENNAVTFTPYYLESNTTRPSAEFVGELGRKIDNGAAYTMVSVTLESMTLPLQTEIVQSSSLAPQLRWQLLGLRCVRLRLVQWRERGYPTPFKTR